MRLFDAIFGSKPLRIETSLPLNEVVSRLTVASTQPFLRDQSLPYIYGEVNFSSAYMELVTPLYTNHFSPVFVASLEPSAQGTSLTGLFTLSKGVKYLLSMTVVFLCFMAITTVNILLNNPDESWLILLITPASALVVYLFVKALMRVSQNSVSTISEAVKRSLDEKQA